MSVGDYLIGVDAGGTKTVAWLCTSGFKVEQRPSGFGQAGAGNPRAVGFDLALERVREAIDQAFASADVDRQPALGICISMAGAGRPEEQERVKAWCHSEGLAEQVYVCGDAEPVLAAAADELTGVALISGTGSFSWGRNASGETARAGGWGYLFGDEGSAYRIALDGLRAATQAVDGVGLETDLTSRLMNELNVEHPQQMIEAIYGTNLSREQIASLAACVFDLAGNDVVAGEIVDRAAEELASMVNSVATRLGLQKGEFRLGLAGGVLVNQAGFRGDVIERVGLGVEKVSVVENPVAGAVVLAGR